MKRTPAYVFLTLLIFVFAPSVKGQRAWTPADTLRVAGVSDAQISPDGDLVVYTVFTTEDNQPRSTILLARLDRMSVIKERERLLTDARGATEPLLPPGLNASNPRWSPDGKRIAFLASKDKQSGIWVVTLAQRQPRFVAPVRGTNFHIPYAGESLCWSPDSRRIAFISATEESTSASAPLVSSTPSREDDPRIVDRIQYKSRTAFSDRARTHVWVVDVDSTPTDEAAIRQLTTGQFYDHALTWNPRGDEVAFLSNHEPDPDANNNSDIFAVDMNGRVRQLTDTRGCEYEPAWSPDGKLIAYTATKRDVTTIDSVAEDAHVWVIDAGGGAGRELTAAQDRRARSPRWSSDSRSIYFLANDSGKSLVYSINAGGGEVETVIDSYISSGPNGSWHPPFQVSSFSIEDSNRVGTSDQKYRGLLSGVRPVLAFTMSDGTHPTELWLTTIKMSSNFYRASAHNEALRRALAIVEPERFKFKSFDGTEIQGWLMKPVGWRADRHYPLILSIHGGPHGMYGYAFNPTFQVYASRGYAVLYLNPRGSSGYGQKFSDGTLREWGGGDYRDLMLGVDKIVGTNSWIDGDRLGVTGGSYGGFMTNWIITQTTRFKAAVAAASVSNLISFYSTSLYQDLIQAEFGGFPWDDYDQLWRWSPLRYVKQAQTPLLLIHGEQDNDVHITQAEEMYMALKRRGVETVLARYPREGHGFREPLHRQDALERTLAWFDRFLK